MIELENLNNQGFEEIVEAAKKQISQLSDDEWTNTQESDPGITLIELFAWLKVLQHNYMNKVSNVSQYKLLEMLDIHLAQNKGAKALIQVSKLKDNVNVPKGTKWLAGDMEFENEKVQSLVYSDIVSAEFIGEEKTKQVRYESFSGSRTFYVFGKNLEKRKKEDERIFKLNFSAPISKGLDFNLYFDVFLEEGYSRNPILENEQFFEMANINWQFYGEKNGTVGWHELKVISDQTHNFLFSGIITFSMQGNMKKIDNGFSIRAVLKDEEYDFSPRITSVKSNVFEVTQKTTLCDSNIITKNDISNDGSFELCNHLAIYGKSLIYVKGKNGWIQSTDYKYIKQESKNKAIFCLEDSLIQKIKDFTNIEDAILVISYDETIENNMVLGGGTGISFQNIKIKYENILYDSFDIMIGNKIGNIEYFNKWNKVYDLFSSDKNAKDYILNISKGLLLFGNNEMSLIPPKGKDNIRIMNMALTFGRRSNIKDGVINKVISKNQFLSRAKIEQITPATGGVDSEMFDDVKAKASKVLTTGKRAVTLEDYESIVKSTPGLIINSVRVLPYCINNINNKTYNSITVVIRGGDKNSMRDLSRYKCNVKNHLDKYRLINTKIYVENPVYIPLSISGQIVVNSYYNKGNNDIENEIKVFIEKLNESCGQPLYYGELFGTIDKLNCVSYVDKFSITPEGENINITLSDDIIIPPNGIYRLDKLDLNFIQSSNI